MLEGDTMPFSRFFAVKKQKPSNNNLASLKIA